MFITKLRPLFLLFFQPASDDELPPPLPPKKQGKYREASIETSASFQSLVSLKKSF